MNREKIANILSQTDGLTITNAEELIEALFFGDINIFERVPYYPEPDRTESKKLEDLLLDALTEKYSKKEAIEIFDRIGEIKARQAELSYKHCFQEGLKIGFALSEFMKE